MATLHDRATRDLLAARVATGNRGNRTETERAAVTGLREAFTAFDGSDLGYVTYLTGASEQDMRSAGAI